MEYHQDRFDDFSLLIYRDEELIALLPANRVENSLYSHQGLTFGGLLLNVTSSTEVVKNTLDTLKLFFKESGIENFTVKSIPNFYFKSFPFDFYEVMLKKKYKKLSSNKVLAIDYSKPLNIHKTKLKRYRNNKFDFKIKESKDFNEFWNSVLIPRLEEKHNTRPVHTLSEISMLSDKFPENIKQYDISLDGEILAGITIFENELVVKSQYGATTAKGEKTRALDYLFLYLIYKYNDAGKQFFSMGSVQDDSYELGFNPGLLKQKEELGCKTFEQFIFKIEI